NQYSLKSTGIIEEDVSVVTQSDWYGPAYPVFFGAMRILTGNFNKSFIITNIILIFLAVFLINKFRIEGNDKKWLWLIVLFCPSVINYSFEFMPVVLDLVFSCILIFQLIRINLKFKE